jgi:glutathione peroxidase
MKKKWWLAAWVLTVLALLLNAASIYKYEVKTLRNGITNLEAYRGKVILIVNITSKCAYTPQLSGLEKLYTAYGSRGFTVLGFPTSQFPSQEPLSGEEIEQFCKQKYGVTFPIFGKIDVYGANTSPLYHYLKSGIAGVKKNTSIEWNFTKYLIDRNGFILRRYSPRVTPEEIAADIEKFL